MKVRRLGRPSAESWSKMARAAPAATFFHTPTWAEIIEAAYPDLSVATQSFALPDGATAILPLVASRHGIASRYLESMVPGVYGGPIAERDLSAAEVSAILDAAVTPLASKLRVVGNPFQDGFRCAPEDAVDFTHVLDLQPGFDALLRKFRKNHRQAYGYGARHGYEIERASSVEDYRAYYEVYQIARSRWGESATTDHPFELLEQIARRAGPAAELWLARLDGNVAAGSLFFAWGSRSVGWHGASLPELSKKFPFNFLLTEAIRMACERGVEQIDLQPSGGHEGVAHFKDSFGARRIHFRHGDRPSGRAHRWLRRIERQLGRRA